MYQIPVSKTGIFLYPVWVLCVVVFSCSRQGEDEALAFVRAFVACESNQDIACVRGALDLEGKALDMLDELYSSAGFSEKEAFLDVLLNSYLLALERRHGNPPVLDGHLSSDPDAPGGHRFVLTDAQGHPFRRYEIKKTKEGYLVTRAGQRLEGKDGSGRYVAQRHVGELKSRLGRMPELAEITEAFIEFGTSRKLRTYKVPKRKRRQETQAPVSEVQGVVSPPPPGDPPDLPSPSGP